MSFLFRFLAVSLAIFQVASIPTRTVIASNSISTSAETDLIVDLPGLPEGVDFKMFSGYIHVDGRKSLFYWFVESMKNPKVDPLVLWTNGGPGCSGLSGFLTEQGPFRPNKRGTLDFNPYAWNKIANMIFIEQPAGVGFSSVMGNTTYDDATAAVDNYRFILGFLDRFPDFKNNPFYITSESYGGHYLPTLAIQLVTHGGVNFKGFAVGNPLTYMPYRDYGQYATLAGHQLIPKPLWDSFLRSGCAMIEEKMTTGEQFAKESCSTLTDEMDRITAGLDPYGLDFPVCNTPSAAGRGERHLLLRKAHEVRSAARGGDPGKGYFPRRYMACEDDMATHYLNRADVQKALHVGRPVVWSVCNETINAVYSPTDFAAPMMGLYRQLLEGGGLRILVFSGDDDTVCATAEAQMWIWSLGQLICGCSQPHSLIYDTRMMAFGRQAVVEPWRAWHTHGQVSGFTVGFSGDFRFATVHGAGHMVPSTRPAQIRTGGGEQGLDLFERFLSGTWEDRARPPPAAAAAAAAAA